MKRSLFIALLAALPAIPQTATFDGRWDLTISTAKETYPSWLEVVTKGGAPQVRIVGRVASVHSAKDVKLDADHLSFNTMEYLGGSQRPISWDLTLAAPNKISGVQHVGTENRDILGIPAPALNRPMPEKWSAPMPLFNGKDLTGWFPDEPAKNHWAVVNGELVNQAAGANLRLRRTFQDFKLHIEYNCPDKGNSGVYLRGRYEVQVEYEPAGTNDAAHGMGSIYGFIAPSAKVDPRPGQWETYDITLVGRRVTVVRDGVKTIDDQVIPGITGGALDSNEGLPGPLYIQGDHTGGMKYRNITISVPERN